MEEKQVDIGSFSPKEKLFIQGMVEHGNATQSARDAGYSQKYAKQGGYKIAKRPRIKAYLAQIRAISTERSGVTQEYVINNLKEMVERCMQRAKVLDKKGDQVYIETADGKLVPAYTFNSAGAAKGLELLGKHLGTFDKDAAKEDERPAFVGISINMGEGTVKMVSAGGNSGGTLIESSETKPLNT